MISVAIVSYNEIANVPRLMKSLKGIEDVVVADDGSTDGTVEAFEKLGARVFRRHDHSSAITDADVDEFASKFDYLPRFNPGDKVFNGSACRNEAVSYAKYDWIFNPDCDEFVTWDLPAIKKMTKECDLILCKLRTPNGSQCNTMKLYNRTKLTFKGRVHELPMPIVQIKKLNAGNKMYIDHYQKPRANRLEYIHVMEYSVMRDNDVRSKFYLGREYYRYAELFKAIKMLHEYLKEGTWVPEVAEAYLLMARCYWIMDKKQEARQACMYAIHTNPDHKAALLFMAEISKKGGVWRRYAEYAKNDDILYGRDA